MIRHIQVRLVQAHAGANLPRQARMLLGGIAAQQQNRFRSSKIPQGSFGLSPESRSKRRIIRRAVVVDIVGAQNRAREFLQQVGLFVRVPV